jgi:hypothetical protein
MTSLSQERMIDICRMQIDTTSMLVFISYNLLPAKLEIKRNKAVDAQIDLQLP